MKRAIGGLIDRKPVLRDRIGSIGERRGHGQTGVLFDRPRPNAFRRGVDIHEALAIHRGHDFESETLHVIDQAHQHAGLIAIGIGILNLFLTAALLSLINWRSRDFNLKKQRRQIRLVDLPKGKPAVVPIATENV